MIREALARSVTVARGRFLWVMREECWVHSKLRNDHDNNFSHEQQEGHNSAALALPRQYLNNVLILAERIPAYLHVHSPPATALSACPYFHDGRRVCQGIL